MRWLGHQRCLIGEGNLAFHSADQAFKASHLAYYLVVTESYTVKIEMGL